MQHDTYEKQILKALQSIAGSLAKIAEKPVIASDKDIYPDLIGITGNLNTNQTEGESNE